MDAAVFPVGCETSSHGIDGLDPESFTAHKLKHASPEHLHQTTRRFFIGPIPKGWLSSNRKSWYKRRLELGSYSSRAASFSAADGQTHHQKTMTGLDRANARINFSFPQPEDVDDDASGESDTAVNTDDESNDEDFEPAKLLPVSTAVEQPSAQEDSPEASRPTTANTAQETIPSDALSNTIDVPSANQKPTASPETPLRAGKKNVQDFGSKVATSPKNAPAEPGVELDAPPNQYSTTDTPDSSVRKHGLDVQQDDVDAGSRTKLISPARSPTRSPKRRDGAKSLSKHEPTPLPQTSHEPHIRRHQSERVRFKVAEAVADTQRRVGATADTARQRVERKMAPRQTLQEGTIVKMEKMLVRVDTTMQQIPDAYDENDSIKLDTRTVEKWREFMVVARKNKKTDEDDFRLQFYKTRVIPEIEDTSTRRKPAREIRLIRRTTHVNLFSSLDKSVVIWHPYRKASRIVIVKCESASHSAEWYTFLRDVLGWKRADRLQVVVPDLGVSLQIEKPFEELKTATLEADDEESAITKAIQAQQAVAGKIVAQCLEILAGNPGWASVVRQWSERFEPGLAWKRYDRLEWIHGANEQKMYGTMAMQQSYELELRPKVHYPQHALSKGGKDHEEPEPVEGFLIRMTSQKGVHKRMGKTFFKRLYFSTQDHLLVFSRPAQATPPHPPRLQTISGSNIPSSRDIIEKTPIMYEIDPFPVEGGPGSSQIKWLASGDKDRIVRADQEAYEEARRNLANLAASDGYINMTCIRLVRKMQWGADSADEALSSGSDVDFHESAPNSSRYDGMTANLDDDHIFELVLDNGLLVRLQAYDTRTRDEWISRLKKLIKYWKLRKAADMSIFKSVRATNLARLKIDEDVEAELGQFGHKWEVRRSEASPELYNMCPISACRTISFSGQLYRKARRHGTFRRCGVVLSGGKMLIYQSALRKVSGEQVPHIHQEKQQVIDLKGCYVYSGLIVEDDLLYQNRTFDANHIGTMASLPRVWTEDGWTSTDVDAMCCFVVWMNTRKGWFRTAGVKEGEQGEGSEPRRATLRRVRQLGVKGRGMVFKCRSRAERDLWVLNVNTEIERLVERQRWEDEDKGGDVRWAG